MRAAEPGTLDAPRSEALARDVVSNFKRHRLRICDEQTYRNHVRIGRRSSYVPAVIRYNAIETRVLLELANLADPIDQQLVLDPLYRERMAWAIYEAVLAALKRPEPQEAEPLYPPQPTELR